MKILKGGHAIMARITLSNVVRAELNAAVEPWRLAWDLEERVPFPPLPFDNLHTTLVFVGRDQNSFVAGSAISAALLMEPFNVLSTGELEVFSTTKGHYLVLKLDRDAELLNARKRLQDLLAGVGIQPKDSFKFNPHVTLLETTSNKVLPDWPLPRVVPFSAQVTELEVKYGQRRMVVDL